MGTSLLKVVVLVFSVWMNTAYVQALDSREEMFQTTLKTTRATSPETTATSPETPATSPETPATSPETPATSPETPATSPETPATSPETTATSPETTATSPETPATSPETTATSPETTTATSPETTGVTSPETTSVTMSEPPAVTTPETPAEDVCPHDPKCSTTAGLERCHDDNDCRNNLVISMLPDANEYGCCRDVPMSGCCVKTDKKRYANWQGCKHCDRLGPPKRNCTEKTTCEYYEDHKAPEGGNPCGKDDQVCCKAYNGCCVKKLKADRKITEENNKVCFDINFASKDELKKLNFDAIVTLTEGHVTATRCKIEAQASCSEAKVLKSV